MIRTFIAIEIPDTIRKIIANFQRSLAEEPFPIRWVKPENIHLTLKFIGEVPPETVQTIREKVFDAPPLTKPFEVTVSGTGVFPNIRKPRVFWIGITRGAEELIHLAGRIEQELEPLKLRKEKRSYKPHLTLGRFTKTRRIKGLEQFLSPDILYAGTFRVNSLVLMKSVLSPEGAEYTPLAEHALAGRVE